MLTPFRNNRHLIKEQKKINKKLSTCRVSIEHAFGQLKQRFRQLCQVKMRNIERICHFIRSCCTLHNLALISGDFIEVENYKDDQRETLIMSRIIKTLA